MATYPVRSLDARNFGPFAQVAMRFSPRVNVVVGDNGTGKSQLLKLLYAATVPLQGDGASEPPARTALGKEVADRLIGVFRPDALGRLTNRVRGRARAEVSLKYQGVADPLSFSFASNSRTEVTISRRPGRTLPDTPVFLPSRELMSIYPGFVSLYNERELEFDETWRDTADLLGRAPLRGPRSDLAASVLRPIEAILDGRVQEWNGRFVLARPGVGNFEMHLVAEGLRKLAMIVRLVQSGVLLQGGYLYWDEPEANLNPRSMRRVAQLIDELAASGVQVFVATHSVFLLRELALLRDDRAATATDLEPALRIVALVREDAGAVAYQADSLDDVPLQALTALEAEVDQADRILAR